jgi:hypothetical protein
MPLWLLLLLSDSLCPPVCVILQLSPFICSDMYLVVHPESIRTDRAVDLKQMLATHHLHQIFTHMELEVAAKSAR